MAIPEAMTTSDISGRWVLNKLLSDSTDPILTAQGISWFTRKTIGLATITVDIKHYTNHDDGFEHIDAAQTLTGGIKGTDEHRVLHGIERDHTDYLFGTVKSTSKRVSYKALPDDVADNAFLREGWTTDTTESEKGMIYTRAVSTEKDWTVVQMWGFERIDEEKRYTRGVDACSVRGRCDQDLGIFSGKYLTKSFTDMYISSLLPRRSMPS